MISTVILWRRRYEAHGYELRRERWDGGPSIGVVTITAAYTLPGGVLIGTAKEARFLCVKKGIRPEPRTSRSTVCSVGRSVKNGKWYGWSHRAIASFNSRAAAARFAESVS